MFLVSSNNKEQKLRCSNYNNNNDDNTSKLYIPVVYKEMFSVNYGCSEENEGSMHLYAWFLPLWKNNGFDYLKAI